MREVQWCQQGGQRDARDATRAWFRGLQLATVRGEFRVKTPPGEESALLILGGTFDLAAGSGSWAQRGRRATPFDGRPCALYLPPDTPVQAVGDGELLLVSCRRPELPPAAEAPPQMRPLLPLAGSGKAFDARTGTWELLERFPSAPEAVLPRAIVRHDIGGTPVERVFATSFKALALRLDEAVVAPHTTFEPRPDVGSPPATGDLAIFVRAPQGAEIHGADGGTTVRGDAVFLTAAASPPRVSAGGGAALVVCAWAWPKTTPTPGSQ